MTKAQRSHLMSSIHSKWTKPEVAIHVLLKRYGIAHTMHPKMKGSPDILIRKEKVVAYINGCFWHGCSRHFILPRSNTDFWRRKISGNIKRDKMSYKAMRKDGWRVVKIWEHELSRPDKILQKLSPRFADKYLSK